MKFYFPGDALLVNKKEEIPGYGKGGACSFQNDPATVVPYSDLSGKYFILVDIQRFNGVMVNNYKQTCLSYTLRQDTGQLQVFFTFPLDATQRSILDKNNGARESLSLTGAVYIGDVHRLNVQVSGKYFYTEFPVGPKNGKFKYQRVKIKKVAPGTWYAPERVFFETDDQMEDSIDVVTTGTNVLPAYLKDHNFNDYFQEKDERTGLTVDNARWNAICQGNAVQGMTMAEAQKALGKPKSKTTTTEQINAHTTELGEQWVYDGKKIYFKDGVVVKIEINQP